MMEMIGDFDLNRDPFDGPQKDSAIKLAQYFYQKGRYIRFHNENSSKSCPGTSIKKTEFIQAVKGETVERNPYPNTVRMGDRGDTVESLQRKLISLGYKPGGVDGIFGAMTYQAVTEFQHKNKLTPDGIVGPQTWNKLLAVEKPLHIPASVKLGSRGDAVELLQEELNHQGYDAGKVDGIFGARTRNALIKFQRDNKLSVDGIAGKNTWKKLLGA
jgi:peptidoglycan hydrolase-like protein with peptidoglycan-binding domain